LGAEAFLILKAPIDPVADPSVIDLLLNVHIRGIDQKGAFQNLVADADNRSVPGDVLKALGIIQPSGGASRRGRIRLVKVNRPLGCTPRAERKGCCGDVSPKGEAQGVPGGVIAWIDQSKHPASGRIGQGDGVAILQEAGIDLRKLHPLQRLVIWPAGGGVQSGAGIGNGVFGGHAKQAEGYGERLTCPFARSQGADHGSRCQTQGLGQLRADAIGEGEIELIDKLCHRNRVTHPSLTL
jgi:hypothetical protein